MCNSNLPTRSLGGGIHVLMINGIYASKIADWHCERVWSSQMWAYYCIRPYIILSVDFLLRLSPTDTVLILT